MVASNYLKQIRDVQPFGPYHLAGHSSGGVIVFEVACQLAEQGEAVALLALLDCDPNKGKPAQRMFRNRKSLKADMHRAYAKITAQEFSLFGWVKLRMQSRKIKEAARLAARSRQSGRAGTIENATGHLMLAFREHELRPYPGGAILFCAQDEPARDPDPARVWAGKILGTCEVCLAAGTHMGMLAHPHVISLAREIRNRLAHSRLTVEDEILA
jgi:thioesterase domain-containing protein